MWHPPSAVSPEAQQRAARPQPTRPFVVCLRTLRHALLDADVQPTLAKSSRLAPGGPAPGAAGVWALATRWPASGHVSEGMRGSAP